MTDEIRRALPIISRDCLRCGRSFKARGRYNRICQTCARRVDMQDEPVIYSIVSPSNTRIPNPLGDA